jgi:hypothetical protein
LRPMNVMLRDNVLKFSIRPVFLRNRPVFKTCPGVPWSFFLGRQNVLLLDLGIYRSHHCSNAMCPYPALMVSDFSVCYLCFLTYGGGNRLGITLAMLAMLWSGSMLSGDMQQVLWIVHNVPLIVWDFPDEDLQRLSPQMLTAVQIMLYCRSCIVTFCPNSR